MADSNTPEAKIEELKALFDKGQLAPGYVFYGRANEENLKTAYELAAHVLSKNQINPNGFNLELTKKFLSKNTHPNFFLLTSSEEGKDIVVENSRELSAFLQSTPTIPGWRFVIISPANRLNNAASNALLKNFEELPCQVTLILVSSGLFQLKATILSRAQKIFFQETLKTIQDYLNSNSLTNQIISTINAAFNQKFPEKKIIETITLNNESMELFADVVLAFFYEKATQNNEKRQFFTKKYEKILNFIISAKGKSLSPAHFVNAVLMEMV